MDHYKQINKELIEEVQKMKMGIAEWQREAGRLNSQYWEQHRQRVYWQKKCERMALTFAGNYRKAMKELMNDSVFETTLKKALSDDDDTLTPASESPNRESERQSQSKERARSMSLQRRSSLNTLSPDSHRTARESMNANDDENSEGSQVQEISEIISGQLGRIDEAGESLAERQSQEERQNLEEHRKSPEERQSQKERQNLEERKSLERRQSQEERQNLEERRKSLEERQSQNPDESGIRNPAEFEIRSTVKPEILSPKDCESLKLSYRKVLKENLQQESQPATEGELMNGVGHSNPLCDVTNRLNTQPCALFKPLSAESSPRISYVVTRRGKLRNVRNENNIQQMRDNSYNKSLTPPAILADANSSLEENDISQRTTVVGFGETIGSLSFAMTELTLENFVQKPCSTPVPSTPQMSTQDFTEQETSSRPRRTCTPTSFVEPNLVDKLRGEGKNPKNLKKTEKKKQNRKTEIKKGNKK